MTERDPIRRDKSTWFCYLMASYAGLYTGILGPITSKIREDLSLSYTLASLHSVFFATGFLTSAILIRHLPAWGRSRTLRIGGAGMTLGGAIVAIGTSVLVTYPGMLVMGLCGPIIMVTAFSALTDHHTHARRRIMMEANGFISLVMGVGAFMVGGIAPTALTWRGAYLLAAVAFLCILIAFAKTTVEQTEHDEAATFSRSISPVVPAVFLVFVAVGLEFATTIWATDFFIDVTKVSPSTAASTVSVFFAAMLFGRLTGSWLARLVNSQIIFMSSLALSIFGFLIFWSGMNFAVSLIGLFVIGLGISNLYPLAYALAAHKGALHGLTTEHVSSLTFRAASVAVLFAPFALAGLADGIGLRSAYLVVPLLAVAGILIAGPAHTELPVAAEQIEMSEA